MARSTLAPTPFRLLDGLSDICKLEVYVAVVCALAVVLTFMVQS
jgi:hypothetical protein